MKEFLLENYKLIISGFLALLSIFIFILRKKNVNDILTWIYTYAVKAVNIVEEESKVTLIKNDVKLNRAVGYVFTWLKAQFPELDVDSYRTVVTKVIKELLSTPTDTWKGGTSDAK